MTNSRLITIGLWLLAARPTGSNAPSSLPGHQSARPSRAMIARGMIVMCGVIAVVSLGASSAVAGTPCNRASGNSLRAACSARPGSFHLQSEDGRLIHASAASAAAHSPFSALPVSDQGVDASPASPLMGGLPDAGESGGFGSSVVGSTPVGAGPSTLAVDSATHTIYVANGYNDNGTLLPAPGNTVSVINARDCQAQDVSRCKGPWPTITVGSLPSGIAIDKQTDTIYVTNVQDNTVSVFNGAACNAETTSGCWRRPVTVPVGLDPLGLFVDPANHTVYIPNFGAVAVGGPAGDSTTVSMIDSATCNATDLAACPTTAPPTVDVGSPPDAITVDRRTHTAYVGTIAATKAFDANTCNATGQSGCGTVVTLTLGDSTGGPNGLQVDPANATLYTANYDNTVSAFDLHQCHAGDLAGCATDAPGTVTVPAPGFDHALWLTVDAHLHSVYVVYQKDDVLKVIDTNLCSGSQPAGCATLIPPEIHTGADPESVILDPRAQTLYTANWADNNVSVIDASRCSAQNTAGCRARPPAVPIPGGAEALATDPTAHTTYVASGSNAVSMINTRTCNADRPTGCAQMPPQVTVGEHPFGGGVAVDRRTHTVYVANSGSGATGTVSVFDDRTCNATDSAGCGSVSTLQVPGGNPDDIAVNPRTDTVYVATITGSGPNLISGFNGATCNATNTTGCGQTPATVKFGDSGAGNGGSAALLAVDHATNTVYATNVVLGQPFVGDSVYVIDGATCDATDTTGCGRTPATVTLGSDPLGIAYNPWGITVDQATHTLYTANLADGEGPGTVSVINVATCNGHDANGCGQTPATAPAGFGANGIAFDRTSHELYVTNTEDTSVTVLDDASCNGTDTSGCSHTPAKESVGGYPGPIVIDPVARTAYVATIDGVSVIPLIH